MAPITASQMRKIYALARELGMDNDLLHIHISTQTGKESLKDLTIREAVQVIDSLEGRGGEVAGMATRRQMAYIQGLMKDLGWVKEDGKPDYDRLNGFLSKRFGVSHYKWLYSSTASKAIEGLKNMVKNQDNTAVRAGG